MAGDHYRDLALALAHYLTTAVPDPDAAALAAGEAWGRHVAETEVPAQDGDLAGLVDTVNGVGFSSRLAEDGSRTILEITRCPYRDAALTDGGHGLHPPPGSLRGYLDGRGSPQVATSLEPWVQENLCVARFADRAAREDRPSGGTGNGQPEAQVLAFRLRGHHLDQRLARTRLVDAAAACGLINAPPHDRGGLSVEPGRRPDPRRRTGRPGRGPDAAADVEPAQSPHVFPTRDAAVFTRALAPRRGVRCAPSSAAPEHCSTGSSSVPAPWSTWS